MRHLDLKSAYESVKSLIIGTLTLEDFMPVLSEQMQEPKPSVEQPM